MTLWKLVTGEEEHKKVASLLADLVGSKVDLPPDSRDALARELGSYCPTFFSQGDVRTFEGLELLRRARTAVGGNAAAATAAEKVQFLGLETVISTIICVDPVSATNSTVRDGAWAVVVSEYFCRTARKGRPCAGVNRSSI